MSNDIHYYKLKKPLGASKDWEANLMALCKKHKINCMPEKIRKGEYIYSLSCTKESFDILVKEINKDEGKKDRT
jgi:hypothetical protein